MTESQPPGSIHQEGTGHSIVNVTTGSGHVISVGDTSVNTTIQGDGLDVQDLLDRLVEQIGQHRGDIDEPDAVQQDAVTLRAEVGRKKSDPRVVQVMLDRLTAALRMIEPLARLVDAIRHMLTP